MARNQRNITPRMHKILLAVTLMLAAMACRPARACAAPPSRFAVDLPPQLGQISLAVSWSHGITNSGIVVGDASPCDGCALLAFTWRDGTLSLLDPGILSQPVDPDHEAYAANNRGQVVGWRFREAAGPRPSLWDNGTAVDLMGAMPGKGVAYGINERGDVVFWAGDAYRWRDGDLTDLGPCSTDFLGLFGDLHYGLQINDRGDVVGDDVAGSFFWRDGVRTQLGFKAEDLNNRGQVVGESFLWEDGRLTDLGSLGGGGTAAQAINDRGEVVGWSLTPGLERVAFRWWHGHMDPLGSLPGFPFARALCINARGQIVGAVSSDASFTLEHVVLWENGRVVDLGSSGLGNHGRTVWINDAGQIVFNKLENGYQSVLWDNGIETPLTPTFVANTSADAARSGTPTPLRESVSDAAARGADRDAAAIAEALHTGLALQPESPTRGELRVRFSLASGEPATLEVFDVSGRRTVAREVGSGPAGWRAVRLGEAAPGMYFLRLSQAGRSLTARAAVLR
jgi:probable HAF family extracellular repeat protein